MNRSIGFVDNLKSVRTPEGDCDVCCAGDGSYAESSGLLEVQLDAFLRTRDISRPERQFRPAWLPHAHKVDEHVDREQASDLARDLFKRWIKKVRETIPEASVVPVS